MNLLTRSQVTTRAARAIRIAGKIESEIHLIATSILAHTQEHGDYSQALVLLNGLPRGTRVKALAFWFKHFSNGKLSFKVDDESKLFVGTLDKDRSESDFDIESAYETSFADLTTEREPVAKTVEKLLRSIVKAASATDDKEVTPEARQWASSVVKLVREAGLDPKMPKAA